MEARDYDLDGYADLYPNAMRSERDAADDTDAGAAYVVSGYRLSGAALAIGEVSPPAAPADSPAEVRIAGDGFTTDADTRVLLAGEEVEDFHVVSRQLIVAQFPPKPAGPPLSVAVENRYGRAAREAAFAYEAPAVTFIRGDANRDGSVDLTDPLLILNALFAGAAAPCADASDVNDDGRVNVTDAVYALEFLFAGGSPPGAPHPDAGVDPTDDGLGCER
jgi:hypothetical protein